MPGPKPYVVGGRCRSNHLLDEDNVYMEGARVRCRTCDSQRKGHLGPSKPRAKLEIGRLCGNGHLLTEENTYRYPNGKLVCKQCRIKSSRKSQGYSGALDDPIQPWRGEPDKPECANGHEYTDETVYYDPTTGYKQCKLCHKLNAFEYRAARYGLTGDELRAKIRAANGLCTICKNKAELVIDHDHSCCAAPPTCGKCTRDLVCHNCNNGLGRFHDSTELLRSAIEYLESYLLGE